MTRFKVVLGASLVASSIAPAAFAKEVEAEKSGEVRTEDGDQVRVVLGLQTGGATGLSGYDGGLELGLSLDVRTAPITIGGVVSTVVHDLFGGSSSQFALHGGHTFMLTPDLAFDVLAEGGLRHETARSGDFLSGDPGTSATQGFVGARLNLDYALTDARAPSVLRLGLSAFARVSLEAMETHSYEYEDCFFTCDTESTTHRVGGTNDLGLVVTLSADFGG